MELDHLPGRAGLWPFTIFEDVKMLPTADGSTDGSRCPLGAPSMEEMGVFRLAKFWFLGEVGVSCKELPEDLKPWSKSYWRRKKTSWSWFGDTDEVVEWAEKFPENESNTFARIWHGNPDLDASPALQGKYTLDVVASVPKARAT